MSIQRYFNYLYFLPVFYLNCVSEKITYINVEHPRVSYYNPAFLNYANLTTTRYGRSNPVYYVGLHYDSTVAFDSNILTTCRDVWAKMCPRRRRCVESVDFYFFEFLTNQYKRSFIEFHFTWCHLVEKDMFFGSALRQGKLLKPCPHPPGVYNQVNMTINPAFIPRGFPFTRGRIQCNLTHAKTKVRVADGFIDMRISQIDKKKARF